MNISSVVPSCGPSPDAQRFKHAPDGEYEYPGSELYGDDSSYSTTSTESRGISYDSSEETQVTNYESGHTRGTHYEYSGHTRGTYRSLTHDPFLSQFDSENMPFTNEIRFDASSKNTSHYTRPLSSSDIYNTLVVGHEQAKNAGDIKNGQSYRSPGYDTYHSIKTLENKSPVNELRHNVQRKTSAPTAPLGSSDIYNTLVVGHESNRNHVPSVESGKVDNFSKQTNNKNLMQARDFTSSPNAMGSNAVLKSGMSARPSTSIETYNALVVGYGFNKSSNNQAAFYIDDQNARSTTPNTLPMSDSNSSSLSSTEEDDFQRKPRKSRYRQKQPQIHRDLSNAYSIDSTGSDNKGANGKTKALAKPMETIEEISCAAEQIENDLFSVFGSLRWVFGFHGSSQHITNNEEAKKEENEDDFEDNDDAEIPTTRLSAELRKQRLRNQVVSYERDTLKQQLQAKNLEMESLKKRTVVLEEEIKKAEESALHQSEKIASMMNDLLEARTDEKEV